MTATTTAQEKARPGPSRWRRRLVLLASLFVALGVLLTLLPVVLEAVAEAQLRKRLAAHAEIVDVDLNLFTGRLRVVGLDTRLDDAEVLGSGELYFDVAMSALFRGELRVESARLSGVVLDLERLEDGRFRLGRLVFPGEQPPATSSTMTPGDGLPFAVDRLELESTRLQLHIGDVVQRLEIDRAELSGLVGSDPEQPLHLVVDATLDAAQLHLDLDLTPLAATPTVAGSVRIEGLDLANQPLAAAVLPEAVAGLAGTVNLDARIALAIGDRTRAHLVGSFGVDGLVHEAADARVTAGRLAWEGTLGAVVAEGGLELDVEGVVQGDALVARQGDDTTADLDRLRWDGRLSLRSKAEGLEAIGDGELMLAGFVAGQAAERLGGGRFDWRGKVQARVDDAGTALRVGGRLAVSDVTLSGVSANGKLAALSLAGNLEADALGAPATTFSARTLEIEADNLDASANGAQFALERLTGKLQLEGERKATGLHLSLAGALDAAAITARSTANGNVDVQLGEVGLRTNGTEVTLEEAGPRIRHPGELRVSATQVTGEFGSARFDGELSWDGLVTLAPGAPTAVSGKLALPASSVVLTDADLETEWQGIDWEGRLTAPTEGAPLVLLGELEVRGYSAAPRAADRRWITGELLTLDGLDITWPGRQAMKTARLDGLALLPERSATDAASAPVRLAAIDLDGLSREVDGALRLDSLRIDGLVATLARDADGRLALPMPSGGDGMPATAEAQDEAQPPAATASVNEPVPAPESGSASTAWQIGRLEVGGESRLRFSDASIDPPLTLDLQIDTLIGERLSSGPGSTPGTLTFAAHSGEYTKLTLAGELLPDPSRLLADLKGKLSEFDLPQLSPYALHHLGHRLTSGQASAEVDLAIADGEINGEPVLLIDQLTVEPVPSEALEALNAQVGMPLDAALSMLRDKNGNIRLAIPVQGAVDDPQFDVSDAIRQALGKATKTAMIGVLTLALQPYGAIFAAVKLVEGAASSVRLDPLPFPSASADDAGVPGDYLERIAGLMAERPGIQVRLCGVATAADRDAIAATRSDAAEKARAQADLVAAEAAKKAGLPPPKPSVAAPPEPVADDTLLALAKERAEVIKRRLAGGGAVASERLFVCLPSIDDEKDAKPRVDLLL